MLCPTNKGNDSTIKQKTIALLESTKNTRPWGKENPRHSLMHLMANMHKGMQLCETATLEHLKKQNKIAKSVDPKEDKIKSPKLWKTEQYCICMHLEDRTIWF